VRALLFVTVFTAALMFAAERPELNGTWQLSSGHEGKLKFDTLQIQQTPDGIKLTEAAANERPIEVACGVAAQDCKLKDGQISFWYNGSALVMMEMHHHNDIVTKTRVVPAADGKSLSLEVTHVEPPGSTATYTFTKQP
jgi:hypothetical protein